MTDLKLMESKEPTYEVTQGEARKESGHMSCSTFTMLGRWCIRIEGDEKSVTLTGPEAIAVSEFIAAHVRKRW